MSNKHDISKDPIIHNLIRRPVLSGEAPELLDLTPLLAYNHFEEQLPEKYRSEDGKAKFIQWFKNFKKRTMPSSRKTPNSTKKTPKKSAVDDDEYTIDYSKLSPTGAMVQKAFDTVVSARKESMSMISKDGKERDDKLLEQASSIEASAHSIVVEYAKAKATGKAAPKPVNLDDDMLAEDSDSDKENEVESLAEDSDEDEEDEEDEVELVEVRPSKKGRGVTKTASKKTMVKFSPPAEEKIKKTPSKGRGNLKTTGSTGKQAPVSAGKKKTPVSSSMKKRAVEFADSPSSCSSSSYFSCSSFSPAKKAKKAPQKGSGTSTPARGRSTPASTGGKKTPVKRSTGNKTPASAGKKKTPVSSSMKKRGVEFATDSPSPVKRGRSTRSATKAKVAEEETVPTPKKEKKESRAAIRARVQKEYAEQQAAKAKKN